ncbi:vacuolar-sorting protein Snf7p [Diutina catenulata]
MWNYLFGGNAQQKKDRPKKAIVQLREQIQILNKKRAHLESQMADQDAIARKNITSNKTVAKNALKRKKGYEVQLDKLENQIQSLENQLNTIEGANLNLETMRAMKEGASAMKQIHGEYNVDKVEDTMEEIREQVELADEISEAISRPVGAEYIDEDELDEELAELQREEAAKEAPAPVKAVPAKEAPLPDFPAVNKGELVEEDDEDERALQELKASMGL